MVNLHIDTTTWQFLRLTYVQVLISAGAEAQKGYVVAWNTKVLQTECSPEACSTLVDGLAGCFSAKVLSTAVAACAALVRGCEASDDAAVCRPGNAWHSLGI